MVKNFHIFWILTPIYDFISDSKRLRFYDFDQALCVRMAAALFARKPQGVEQSAGTMLHEVVNSLDVSLPFPLGPSSLIKRGRGRGCSFNWLQLLWFVCLCVFSFCPRFMKKAIWRWQLSSLWQKSQFDDLNYKLVQGWGRQVRQQCNMNH